MKSTGKKILKIGLPIVSVFGFTALIVCVSGVLVKTPTISIGGSNAILPLMNAFGEKYKDVDIVTSAGGSGAGINSIIDGTKEIGMASKNPKILDLEKNDNKYKSWKNKNVKTLTIAWDGIGIIYKPSLKSRDTKLNIDASTLAKLYTSFSGLKNITFDDLFGNGDTTVLKPFARNGGSNISGTADAFLKDSHLDYETSSYWASLSEDEQNSIHDRLENGSYGSNVTQTSESNLQAWNRAKRGDAGSVVYLSAGFILNNINEIKNSGFEIATYNNIDLENLTITNGYNWYRPFNLIYSIEKIKTDTKVAKMLWWFFSEQAKEIVKREGYVSLTDDQLKLMTNDKTIPTDYQWLIDPKNSDVNLGYCGAGEAK